MGRKRDCLWRFVDSSNGNRCSFCRHAIPGASRFKFHLAQVAGQGVRLCDNVPEDVKSEAISALNHSSKRVKQSRSIPPDLDKNDIGSSLSRRKQITGRKRDDFWQFVDTSNGKKCIFCGHKITGATRIKFHLAQVVGEGIRVCDKVPDDVKHAAELALNDSSNEGVKQFSSIPTDLDQNDTSSSLLRGSTRGEVEVDLLPTTDLVGKQFQRHIDEIWKWLIEDDVSVMGVWGMGGVGKTALLKHIYNKLLIHNHHVIWITVSQSYSLHQLQRDIAISINEVGENEGNMIGVKLLEHEGEVTAAMKLLRAFKKMKKCVVILDDVWCDIPLEDVGIPFHDSGIRTIVASRLLDVCISIGCKHNIVKVKCLPYDEAVTLFSKILGDNVTLLEDIAKIAGDLIGECGGLPLAIVAIARSMRGKIGIREWRDALSKLRSLEKDHNDIKRCIFPVLKSSFNYLNCKTVQDCLLCLPLYIEHKICTEDLIRIFVDEGLIDARKHFEAQLDDVHSILNKLRNDSLLDAEIGDDCVQLHVLVRAMAVNIGKESCGYIYNTKLPDEQEWKEDLQKISLISDEMTEIPFGISPKCPKLSTLRMCSVFRSILRVIPDCFFINMPALKILDLSRNKRIDVLPMSISNLKCLTVLLLAWCESLHDIPSLAKLKQLRRLDLSYTAITEVPPGFENLTSLRWLHLEGTAAVKAKDLEKLSMLESIGATFVDKDEFIACVQIVQTRINSGMMRGYFLRLLGDAMVVPLEYGISHNIDHYKTIEIEGVEHSKLLLPSDIDVLEIKGCNHWKSLCDALSIQQSNNKLHISKCSVDSCNDLEYLFCSTDDCILCSTLQGVNELDLGRLNTLSMLCKENKVASSFLPFSCLTKLSIWGCKGMKKLLTPGMSTQLHNFEEIKVEHCESMEEIFSGGKSSISDELRSLLDIEAYAGEMDDTNIVEAISLPNLKSVSLLFLPQLKSVCKGIILCDSLMKFNIFDCPQLKCVPLTQPPFMIQVWDRNYQKIQLSKAITMISSK